MKNQHKWLAATCLIVALGVVGCSRNGDDTPPVDSSAVPDSAGVGTGAFVSFILGLSGSDESSEPLTLNDTFAVPPDETAEPTPLT